MTRSSNNETSRTLPYGRLQHRLSLRKWILICGTVLVIGVALYWSRSAISQADYLLQQRKLLRHTLPKDAIVYEHPDGIAEKLLQDQERYTAARKTDVITRGSKLGAAFYYPRSIQRLIPEPEMDALAYLHERTSANGRRRLVAVWIDSAERIGDVDEYLVFRTLAFEPAGSKFGSRLRRLGRREARISHRFYNSHHIRVFSGQSDPIDPARFTIEYSMQGQRGFIEGHLNSSDEVTLLVRSGPLWDRVGPHSRSPVKDTSASTP